MCNQSLQLVEASLRNYLSNETEWKIDLTTDSYKSTFITWYAKLLFSDIACRTRFERRYVAHPEIFKKGEFCEVPNRRRNCCTGWVDENVKLIIELLRWRIIRLIVNCPLEKLFHYKRILATIFFTSHFNHSVLFNLVSILAPIIFYSHFYAHIHEMKSQ